MTIQKLIIQPLLAVSFIICTSNSVYAQNDTSQNSEIKPLILRSIMSDLGTNMQAITLAIAREDWSQVTESALLIADHPKPPITEKVRILSFAGKKMRQFKSYDDKTHNAALKLSQIAKEKDGYHIITVFSDLQKTCLGCHQKFRHSFQQHFYPNQ
jgi:cytochrome c556